MSHTNNQPARVLIVDDEPRILRSLQAALTGKFDVVTAGDGIEAQAIMKAQDHFDVIVSDERMPKLRGRELMAWSQQHYPDSSRIMLTSGDTDDLRASMTSVDAFGYLQKPWNISEFRTLLEQAADQSQKQMLDQKPANSLHERPPGILGVLDCNKAYFQMYDQISTDCTEISSVLYFKKADELIEALPRVGALSVVFLDVTSCSLLKPVALKELLSRFNRTSFIVTAPPAILAKLIKLGKEYPNLDFIPKPMSFGRLKSVVLRAVEKHARLNKH